MTQRRDVLEIATDFLDTAYPQDWARRDHGDHFSIDANKVDDLTDSILDLIANIVASILDAGSERDAVNENDALREIIADELRGWSHTEPEGETNK
jgi:hypothetical protein